MRGTVSNSKWGCLKQHLNILIIFEWIKTGTSCVFRALSFARAHLIVVVLRSTTLGEKV